MAIVVDEFGTISGLVTMEDVLEQVFGEIEDEHDELRAKPPAEADMLELEGATSIRDLHTQYGIELPGDAGFETLAGFLLFQLGEIPKSRRRASRSPDAGSRFSRWIATGSRVSGSRNCNSQASTRRTDFFVVIAAEAVIAGVERIFERALRREERTHVFARGVQLQRR